MMSFPFICSIYLIVASFDCHFQCNKPAWRERGMHVARCWKNSSFSSSNARSQRRLFDPDSVHRLAHPRSVIRPSTGANSPLFAEHYPLLLGLNAAIALALLGLVVYQLAILARQRRAKVFGSLLTFRVLVMFALVGVVPGLLVYTVSLQFLAKSIESWFDVRVERALEGGLNLGRAALDVMLNELLLKAHVMALDLSETPRRDQAAALARLREQAYVEEAWLMTDGGQVLARASREPGKLVPPGASVQALRDARQVRGYAVVEPVGDKGLLLRVIVSLETSRRGEEPRLSFFPSCGLAASKSGLVPELPFGNAFRETPVSLRRNAIGDRSAKREFRGRRSRTAFGNEEGKSPLTLPRSPHKLPLR